MYNMNAFIDYMPFNMIYYQSSFTKSPFLLFPHWILAYVLHAAFERFFESVCTKSEFIKFCSSSR